MINGYQAEILKIYENIRETEAKNLKLRRLEVSSVCPEILELDNEIQRASLRMSLEIIKADDGEKTLTQYKEKITDLRVRKCEMLVANGYDPEYLNLKYTCSKCKDTGFIGANKCHCYKQKLIRLHYKDSELENTIKENNFNNFDLNLFSTHRLGDEKYSPRKNIENILEYILNDYIPNFSSQNVNLLFFGNPGSGKTYLSYCLSKAILDKGYLVVYKTSDELIKNLSEIRFNNNHNLESLLLNCDLLIIDDLGAEHLNEFSITELFNIINKRILNKKKMLISTNLTLPGITKQYTERIASRLLGDFKLYKFYSEDIRIQKNLQKNK
ncbi:DNA replication protein DnaC [Clostridium botulinum]|uniref:DNA replication protein DnaC n=2 Tax=Clostridium botulinum TaxID=1491 RepID=A0A0C2N5E9_CLOBO|nr:MULTISPECIES: ATP-binding protein [Clostridium]ACD52271.1 dnaC family protein [Clostridium botulinum E3 str. Alaska E43]AJF31102.1 DNA replication protein DnaC [Clostridium botulinum]AJF34164.1 DNA replication protein DnaC [Clostridium botulinum]KAI3347227.1 ATP-binding protein [Clostridium botulinum]KIL08320.1 DNA replication protein DnaC [Clostridium botulinum]